MKKIITVSPKENEVWLDVKKEEAVVTEDGKLDFEATKKKIDTDIAEFVPLTETIEIMVDEMGYLREDRAEYRTLVLNYQQNSVIPVMGKCAFVHRDEEGEIYPLTEDEIEYISTNLNFEVEKLPKSYMPPVTIVGF